MHTYLEPPFDPHEEPDQAREPAPAKQLRQFVDAKAEVGAPATLRQRPPDAAGDRWSGLALLAALALLFAVSDAALAQTTVTQSGGGATWSLVGETSLTTGQTYTYTLTLTGGTKPQNEHFGLTSSTLGLNRFKRGIDTCSGGYYFCYAMRNASTHQEFTVNNVNFSGHVLGSGSPYEMTLVVALDTPVGTQVNLGVVDRHGIPRADAMQLTVTEAADTTAPRVSDATVDGASLVITFNEDLATAANLANSAFTVKKTSSRGEETTVTLAGSPSISGATVTLTLTAAVVSSDAVTVSYAKPTSGMDNALADAAGNQVARFRNRAVTNNTPNNPPTAADSTVTTDEDTAYTFAASDFNFADTDTGDALASVTITTLESAGDLELDGTDVTANQVVTRADIDASKLRFTPAENANGSAYATFRFTVSDGADDSASAYTMSVDVTAVNDPPTVANAIPDQTATEGAAFSFQFAANTFDDVDDNTLTYTAVEDGESALPSWLSFDAGTRTFSGTPAAADAGTVTVKVTASNDDGASASDAFDITVNAAANNPPTAADNTVTTDEDTAYTFAASDFNFADTDTGDTLASVTITTLESAGDLELDGTDVTANQVVTRADIDASKLRFTPAANANGTAYATFRFTVSDGADDSASSYTMTVDVTAVNDPPTAADSTVTTDEDTAYTFAASDFGFADADTGDALASVTITALESAGDLELDGTDVSANQVVTKADIDASKLTFTPAENANGTAYATFRFTVSDGADDSASSYTMTIDVTAVNDPPTVANAIPDQTATAGAAFSFQFAASTFDDVDDHTLTYTAVEDGESALPSWLSFDAGTRTFSGTPASTDVGTVTVRVTASDDDSASVSDTFDITVSAAANNPPTAADNTVTTDEDTAYTFAASDFGFADTDADDALASVTITALESTGDLELDGADVTLNQVITTADIDASKLTFTPAENANGSAYATFRFTVSDGADDSASSYTMTVDVTAVNDPPTVANAIPDQTATAGAAFSFQFAASTFDDVDDNTLTYTAVEDGESALPSWLSFDAGTRTFSGTPASTDVGTVTVKVTASDDDSASVSDTFDITVSAAANNPPTAADNTVTTDEDTAYTFAASDFGFADTDAGDALASVTITALESTGDLELDGADVTLNQVITTADIDASKLTFTPAENANGSAYATFRFTVSDGADDSASSYTMTVDVTAVNDPPTVANAIPDQTATAGAAFSFQFAASTFDDVDDNTLTYTAVEDGESGLPSWLSFDAGTRTFSGTPASTDVGTVTVKVTASDDDGASVSDAFDITVNAAASNPATGQPGITGTPQVGQALTATVGNINDTDGLPTFPGDYRFQWVQVGGGTETDVGTDSHEYAPPTAAIGKAIKVKVTFNDTDGNSEGPLESDETAAVVAMQEDCATNRPGNDWCATMTVEVGGAPSVTTYGFRSGQGALSDTTINYGGTLYTLGEIIFADYRAASAADGFDISVSDYLPRGSEFDIGGATLAADASSETTTFHAGSGYSWDAANPGWIDGQKVTVSANLAPVVTAAEVNGHQLVLTFAEDLDANSKPAASAFTVYVNGGAGANPSSVDTISGKTVTMTLATAVTSGQTVTLDYAVPETNPLRDESELNAPAFTGRTVTNNTPVATNNAPTAADNTVTTDEDTTYTFAASDFNFADPDTGDALASVTITTLESAGDLDLDGTDVTLNQVVTKADIDAGKLTFTPAENANGSAYATFGFKVNDGIADSTDAYTMTVDVTAVNDPPTVANAIPDQTATVGAAFSFQFAANTFDDVDDNTLTYTAVEDGESGLPSWLSFDAGTRTFSGTPAAVDAGTVSVKVTASDDDGASVSDAFVITVSAAANHPATGKPGIDGTPQVGQTLTTTAGTMADDDNLPATTFPEGYSFQWVQVDGPTETEISGATSQTYVPVAGDVGRTLKVKVTFTDGGGAEEMLTSDETDAVIALPAVIPTLDSPEAFFANGALRYRFDLRLSEGVSIPHEEMRDHAFSVTNGHMDKAQRIHKQRTGGVLYSNHWRMTVAPDDETKPVTVTLRGNRPCGEEGALCSSSGGWLDGSPTLTLSTETNPPDLGSLPSLSIADTSGTEDSANLAFDVSLSKAVSATIAVDFRTVSGGTATANADYQEAKHRILFAAGETVKPGSVALMEDAATDPGETVNVEITNARVITPRGAEFGPLSITRAQATGTIDAPASSKTPLPNVDMRIENTSGSERGGWLHFTIALSRALDEYVCYDFETLGTGTASEGVDYLQRPKSTLWQPPGVTEWTEFVRILDDSIDDGGETVQARISDAELCDDASKTITISRADATGTITNSDPLPAAWLARFGRTVADQVIDAVEGRMEAARAPGTEVHFAGQRVGASGAQAGLGTLHGARAPVAVGATLATTRALT